MLSLVNDFTKMKRLVRLTSRRHKRREQKIKEIKVISSPVSATTPTDRNRNQTINTSKSFDDALFDNHRQPQKIRLRSTPSSPPATSTTSANRNRHVDRSTSRDHQNITTNRIQDRSVPSSPTTNRSQDRSAPSSPTPNRNQDRNVPSSPTTNRSQDRSVPSSPTTNRSQDRSVPSSPTTNRSLDQSVTQLSITRSFDESGNYDNVQPHEKPIPKPVDTITEYDEEKPVATITPADTITAEKEEVAKNAHQIQTTVLQTYPADVIEEPVRRRYHERPYENHDPSLHKVIIVKKTTI